MSTTQQWPTEIASVSDWEIYLELQRDEEANAYIGTGDATVTATVYTLSDAAVPGGGPIALACIDENIGTWRGRIPYTASVTAGTTYKVVVDIVVTTGPRRRYVVYVKIAEIDG